MKALIDGDVLRYEIGAVGEYVDDDGRTVYRDFDWVSSTLDDRISSICHSIEDFFRERRDGKGPEETIQVSPKIFLSGSRKELLDEYIPNFREAIAVSKPYKGTRKEEKPFHYDNITAYIISKYNHEISNGCEADDLICIEQFSELRVGNGSTIICTRDKDLRMCPGWHYGWECGKQPEFGPIEYDDIGEIELVRMPSGNKIVGGGKAFFFSQLLTGDTVDNIGGLERCGPVKAFKLLSECKTEEDFQSVIKNEYQNKYADRWLEYLQEQSDLLWIIRELDDEDNFMRYLW